MRVPGLPIWDCKRGCNNRAQMCAQLSATNMIGKTSVERLYLVLGLPKNTLCVSCPCAPTTPTIHCATISRFLCNSFPQMALSIIHQVILPSPGTLLAILKSGHSSLRVRLVHSWAAGGSNVWILLPRALGRRCPQKSFEVNTQNLIKQHWTTAMHFIQQTSLRRPPTGHGAEATRTRYWVGE